MQVKFSCFFYLFQSSWVSYEILLSLEKSQRESYMCCRLCMVGISEVERDRFQTGELKHIPSVIVDFNDHTWADQLLNSIRGMLLPVCYMDTFMEWLRQRYSIIVLWVYLSVYWKGCSVLWFFYSALNVNVVFMKYFVPFKYAGVDQNWKS